MFITVNRLPGDRPLRLAVQAIGYLDVHPEGANIRLVGDHALLVRQTSDEIEDLIAALAARQPAAIDESKEEQALTKLEGAGMVDARQATEQRIDRATRRGRGPRA
ncbi:hypothetical protein ACWGNZ_00720 [Sphingomonas zeae]